MSGLPARGSHPTITSWFGPSARPLGAHEPSGNAFVTTGCPATIELVGITSSSPSGFAAVPSLLMRMLFVPASYAHDSRPEEPVNVKRPTMDCVSVLMNVVYGGGSGGLVIGTRW